MSPTITFRLIAHDDIPTLHRWRNAPHVAQWWQPPTLDYPDALEEYTFYMRPDSGVRAYIIQLDQHPIGYMQAWQVKQFPDYNPYVALSPHTTGLDLFIGEAQYLHRGLGAYLIQAFIQAHVFVDPSVMDCIIDPLPENRSAIRAYEKVGFVYETTFAHEGSRVYFMRLTRATMKALPPLAPIT